MYKVHSRNIKTPKQGTWEDPETNELTQRGLQQTPKWNKGHYKKKEIHELYKTTQNIKKELKKDMGNLRKKESNRNPGNKKSL
jgi:hypothetical protein